MHLDRVSRALYLRNFCNMGRASVGWLFLNYVDPRVICQVLHKAGAVLVAGDRVIDPMTGSLVLIEVIEVLKETIVAMETGIDLVHGHCFLVLTDCLMTFTEALIGSYKTLNWK